MTQYCGFE